MSGGGGTRTGRDGDNSVGDLLAEVRLSGLLHLRQNHGGDLLGGEGLEVALVVNLDDGLAGLLNDLERPVLHVLLNFRVVELATDETLRVEDRVLRVGVECVLRGITDTERRSEGSIRGGNVITHSRSSSVKETHDGVIR